MRNKKLRAVLLVLAFATTLLTAIGSSAQNADNARLVPVPQGQKQKIQGVVGVRKAIISPSETRAAANAERMAGQIAENTARQADDR